MARHVYPWWGGFILASPLRRLSQVPESILRPHVVPGMTVVDVGCGMGFFSLPMAELAGPRGRVVCVDLQPKMLGGLARRAARAGLSERVMPRLCGPESLGIEEFAGLVDFVLAFNVVHELPDRERFLDEILAAMRAGAMALICEPRWHVSEHEFEELVRLAALRGLAPKARPAVPGERSALLVKASST